MLVWIYLYWCYRKHLEYFFYREQTGPNPASIFRNICNNIVMSFKTIMRPWKECESEVNSSACILVYFAHLIGDIIYRFKRNKSDVKTLVLDHYH
jgi:hypothetical protein